MNRYLSVPILKHLDKKMSFIGGPRQVGKTTLAKNLLESHGNGSYFNWDVPSDRPAILNWELPEEGSYWIFDEIHKYKKWRGFLKGVYDKYIPPKKVVVTGSARLDYYRKGGDSLVGRYFYYRLHPLSIQEISKTPSIDDLNQLFHLGGFPEPFLNGSQDFARLWRRERVSRIVTQDLRDLERINEISLVELLVESIPERVGSNFSFHAVSSLLQVAPETVKRWVDALSNIYILFVVPPYGESKIRALKKEKKIYLWDWSTITDDGDRFENMVACQLLKYCHFVEDSTGHKLELRYLRDTAGREVDFVVLKNKAPLFAVECKLSEKDLSPAIAYFKDRTKIPKFYQVHMHSKDFGSASVDGRILPFAKFCKEEGMP